MNTRIEPAMCTRDSPTWESQYLSFLASKRLGERALRELVWSADRVSEMLRFPPPPGLNCGAIIGAVQSGKTGLMIELVARAFDKGYRVAIVLAGLKDDLRTQTAL